MLQAFRSVLEVYQKCIMGKLEIVTNLKSEPIIGQFYLVPCIRTNHIPLNWIPIVGDFHTDSELRIPEKHFHYDVRFIPGLFFPKQSRNNYPPEVEQIGRVIGIEKDKFELHAIEPIEVELKRRKCLRRMPEFPLQKVGGIHNEMHKKYHGKSVKCGKCPHRNFPLENLPKDENGFIICNGHGLKINSKTMKVENRFL